MACYKQHIQKSPLLMFVAASSPLLVNYYYMGIPMHWCCARILLAQSYTTNTHDHDDDDDASTKENQFFQGIRSVFCFYVHHDHHHHTLGNMLFSLPVLVCRCVCVCAFAFILFLSFALMMAFCYVVVFFYILTIYFNVQASNLHVSVCVCEREIIFSGKQSSERRCVSV